jgi:hypothetical protein
MALYLSGRDSFFIPLQPHIAAGWLKGHMWHSLPFTHNQWKFGRNRAKRVCYYWGRNSFSSLHCLQLQRVDTNIRFSTARTHVPEPVQIWSKSGSNEGHFSSVSHLVFNTKKYENFTIKFTYNLHNSHLAMFTNTANRQDAAVSRRVKIPSWDWKCPSDFLQRR